MTSFAESALTSSALRRRVCLIATRFPDFLRVLVPSDSAREFAVRPTDTPSPYPSKRTRSRAMVRSCPVAAPLRPADATAAAVRAVVTSYSNPGDRILLTISVADSRVAETVFRLGRRATTPSRRGALATAAAADRFDLIIGDRSTVLDWADYLARTGRLVVLAGPGHHPGASGGRPFATGSGLVLVDRLVLVHLAPSPAPPRGRGRLRVVLGSHRRIHTDALIFRPAGGSRA
ncbi:hypothetical protein [Amycolatopsis sacchari]|uniref:hypothetical protein n=1 Tax=Amycolatopsis sacchari TaxID=115433 RepID=UPI001178C393|nr:hypothetical protein [Amycolatopsis sacchari]